jgi:hypothetical protein
MKSFYELKKHRKYRAVLLGSVYEGTMVKLYPNPDVIKMRNVTLFGLPNKKSEFSFFSKDYDFYDAYLYVYEILQTTKKEKADK